MSTLVLPVDDTSTNPMFEGRVPENSTMDESSLDPNSSDKVYTIALSGITTISAEEVIESFIKVTSIFKRTTSLSSAGLFDYSKNALMNFTLTEFDSDILGEGLEKLKLVVTAEESSVCEGKDPMQIKLSTDVEKYIEKYNLDRDVLVSYLDYLDTILEDYPVRRKELIVTPAIDDRQRLRYIIYVAKDPVDIEIEIADRFIERFPDEEFVDFSIGVRRDHV